MPKTPPPPLKRSGEEPPEESHQSTMSKIGQNIKGRLGDIQTKPDIFGKIRNYRFGEIQTKPDWMKRDPKQQSVEPEHIEWIRIIPIAGQKYVTSKFPSKLGSIEGVVHFRFYKDSKSKIHIYAGHTSADGLRKALRQRVPNTDLQQTGAPPSFDEKIVRRSGDLGGTLNEKGELEAILDALEDETYLDIAFENCPEQQFKQPLRQFVQGGGEGTPSESSGMLDNFKAFNEAFNPFAESRYSEGGGKTARGTPKSEMSAEQKDQLKRVEHLLGEHSNYFRVTIKIGTKNSNHVQPIFSELSTQLKQQHRFSIEASGKRGKGRGKAKSDVLWREEELGALVTLPDMTNAQMARSVTHLKPGERTLGDDELNEGVAIGRLIHPTKQNRLIKIPTNQFLNHGFLAGKTGAGKSSTLIQAVQSVLDDWIINPDQSPGFTCVDPNGSAVRIIINRLRHMESHLGLKVPWEKVHYLDMRPESQYPVGLNLLHCDEEDDMTEVSQNIVDLLMSTYGGSLSKTEKLMDNALLTLLSDRTRTHTVFGMNYAYMYPEFRQRLNIDNPMLRLFWKTEGDHVTAGELTAMNSRLRPLLSATSMRRIFGQTKWSLDIWNWMEEGHIVLVDALNLSDFGRSLAMGQLLTQYHNTAKHRTPDISKPHILMIDEAHLVQIPILDKVVAEDRKFGLSLLLITQYPEQLKGGSLLDAITENMGTFMCCKVGPKSARSMTLMMNNAFDAETLQELPGNEVAVLTEIEKVSFSFKVKSDPPIQYLPSGKVAKYDKEIGGETWQAQEWAMEKVLELAERDGRPVGVVDQEFQDYDQWWQQFDTDEEPAVERQSERTARSVKQTPAEQSILNAILQLVADGGDWGGYAKSLQVALWDYLNEDIIDDYSPSRLGLLLSRSERWFLENGIQAKNERKENGSYWTLRRR